MQLVAKLSGRAGLVLATCLTLVASLGGCGFQPLYGEQNGKPSIVLAQSALVQIAPIPDRLGQEVRNYLLDSLNTYGEPSNPTHRLEVRLDMQEEGVGYRRDEAKTRFNIRLNADYRLIEAATGKVVMERHARGFVAYDVVQSDYATLAAEQDAKQRAAREVSEDISTRIGLFFAQKPAVQAAR